ncbi:MAG: hypothetical protein HKP31_01160 [Nitrosopumilus sp.]|nr:hypothetical protein [Nitrosopumilus sp.]
MNFFKNFFLRKHVGLPLLVMATMFLIYSRFQESTIISPDVLQVLERLAIGFYLVISLSIVILFMGLHSYHKNSAQQNNNSLQFIISSLFLRKRSKKIFWITFFIYGAFFSLASGTLIYQPDVSFSLHYGADVPSAFIAPCCDPLGYMPKIIVYLTENVGLQIIPINLLLQITVSYLVAFNMTIAIPAISLSKKTGGFCGTGTVSGLFIACPTCAGTILTLFFGTALSSGVALYLIQLQTFFIALSIPVLLLTPIYMAKKFKN